MALSLDDGERVWLLDAPALQKPKILLLAGCFDGTCTLWQADLQAENVPTFLALRKMTTYASGQAPSDQHSVLAVSVSIKRGVAVAGTNGGSVCLWRLEDTTKPPAYTYDGAHSQGLTSLAWSSELEMWTCSEDGRAKCWAWSGWSKNECAAVCHTTEDLGQELLALAWGRASELFAASMEGFIHVLPCSTLSASEA